MSQMQRMAAEPAASQPADNLMEPARPAQALEQERVMAPAAKVVRAERTTVRGAARLALAALMPFLFFWRLWWPDPAERRVLAGDFVEQYYPMRAFVAYELRHGRLPLWDPFTYGGQPAAGASLYAPFYPPGLWETLLPDPLPFQALELEAVAHLALAGVFMYLLVRRLTGSENAGMISAAAFSLGGYLTSYPMPQLLILETAAWLPGGLWLIEGALAERSLRRAALAGAAFGCALLAGHPQTFLYAGYLAAAYFAMRAWRTRAGWRFAGSAALLAGGIALALGAVQWLPTLELARLSPRAHMPYDELANGFRLADAWGIFRPNSGQPSPLYVGLLPLGLAAAGLALGRARRPDAWFWGAAGGMALLLAFGRNAFAYPLAYRFLPGFSAFRDQERAALIVSLALAVLAGYGYAALMERLGDGRRTVKRSLILIVALTFFDLYGANGGVGLERAQPAGMFPTTGIVAHLQAVSLPGWRTSSEGLLPGDGNAGSVYRVRDVAGNSPLHLAAYDSFLNEVPELRWWYLLNVQHLVTRRPLEHGALKLVMQEGDMRLYQVFLQAQPAWIVHRYQVAADRVSAMEAAADPALDPRSEVVLEAQPGAAAATPDRNTADRAQLVSFEPGRVAVDAQLAAPGVLVASEVDYPGWTAFVRPADGSAPEQEAHTLRAYGLLRAVALPAGNWRVEWRYEPGIVRAGAGLGLIALLMLALALGRRSAPRGEGLRGEGLQSKTGSLFGEAQGFFDGPSTSSWTAQGPCASPKRQSATTPGRG